MKQLFLTTVLALVALPAAMVQAGESYCPPAKAPLCKTPISCDPTGYIFGYAGYTFGHDVDGTDAGIAFDLDADGGFLVGGGAGIYSDLFCGSRFEFEALYSESDFATTNNVLTGESETYALMVNALKEIPFGCVTGYVGAGIGYAWNEISSGGVSDDDGAFAYQLIVGGDLPVTDCISLFAQYKLLGIGDTDYFNNLSVDQYFTHSIAIGARYSF